MNMIEDILAPESVLCDVPATSRKRVLQALAETMTRACEDDRLSDSGMVFDRLVEREHHGSTGIGQGCALPHACVEGVSCACAVFLQLAEGVDFDSPDGDPVDIVFGLLLPRASEEDNRRHLEVLALIAGLLSDQGLRDSLRSSSEPGQIRRIIIDAARNTSKQGATAKA
ncbi:PTS sugar transporter subunit IIA [Thioalkalivibrio sp. HK1]|uniref:PTS sugar transporter subunit IIA n=1 Tax=Thioalkalivibrio sp. HK1 TaxID=1469245 RepID=UPI0004716CCE|nr:PTS sugar transporter subunit IIA [Thioalkalivibrio sp. HK1]